MAVDPNKLAVSWNKRENDFVIRYPRKRDGSLIHHRLLSTRLDYRMGDGSEPDFEAYDFIKDLESRGYDLKTLQFSIKLKEPIH